MVAGVVSVRVAQMVAWCCSERCASTCITSGGETCAPSECGPGELLLSA